MLPPSEVKENYCFFPSELFCKCMHVKQNLKIAYSAPKNTPACCHIALREIFTIQFVAKYRPQFSKRLNTLLRIFYVKPIDILGSIKYDNVIYFPDGERFQEFNVEEEKGIYADSF